MTGHITHYILATFRNILITNSGSHAPVLGHSHVDEMTLDSPLTSSAISEFLFSLQPFLNSSHMLLLTSEFILSNCYEFVPIHPGRACGGCTKELTMFQKQ